MPIDVPAYVLEVERIENHVVVAPGVNWDLARSARTTPILVLPDPEPTVSPAAAPTTRAPDDGLPSHTLLTVFFSDESTTIGKPFRVQLERLSKKHPLLIVGRGALSESDASRLSRTRAKAVTEYLRARGYTVKTVKALGSTKQASTHSSDAGAARVVEIFEQT